MSYTPTTWAAGDAVTAAKMNNIENGIKDSYNAIDNMGCIVETINSTTPTIIAEKSHQYICGELTSLSFTPCSDGICDIVFQTGTTPTTLTVPNTVSWPDWFVSTALYPSTYYELNVLNGTLGAVATWT